MFAPKQHRLNSLSPFLLRTQSKQTQISASTARKKQNSAAEIGTIWISTIYFYVCQFSEYLITDNPVTVLSLSGAYRSLSRSLRVRVIFLVV